MSNAPYLSIVIPIHQMQGGADFLWKSINMLTRQTFKDWELIITQDGLMAENTNSGIKRARGKLIKILYLDDMLSDEYALEYIVLSFTGDVEWLITGTDDNLNPYWTDDIETGNNRLGSPSALTIRNHVGKNLLFDEKLSWLLDCDYYKRMYKKYGLPKILEKEGILIGKHVGQMTNLLSNEVKSEEFLYLKNKYV